MTEVLTDQSDSAGLDISATRRLLGVAFLVATFVAAFVAFDLPNLDGVREDVAIATTVDTVRSGVPADQVSNCFQGFCFEDDAGVLNRWWSFSSTYLRLTWIGIALALLAASVVETLLVPGAMIERTASRRSLHWPSIAAIAVLFSPLLLGIRVGLAVLFVAVMWRTRHRSDVGASSSDTEAEPASMSETVATAGREVFVAFVRLAIRLGPLFVAAAAIGGLATQYLTEAGVEAVVGDHALGIALVALVGATVAVPPLFEIPLAAAALLVGMGRVTAGVLLFAVAIGGPALSWVRSRTGVQLAAAIAAVAVGIGGGSAALAASNLIETATVPTIAFDGEVCSYTGPMRFGPGVADFVIRNDTEDGNDGFTMAIVVGRLPDNVAMDHFALEVAADPTAPLPEYFTVAGTREFVFPGTQEPAQITFHTPGRYAAVCLNGGGFYVIFEFSMPQPMGWFDEFRSTFNGYVADEVFTVAG